MTGFENADFDFNFELFDEQDSELNGSDLILPDSPPDSSGCSEPYSPQTESDSYSISPQNESSFSISGQELSHHQHPIITESLTEQELDLVSVSHTEMDPLKHS